MSEPVIEYEKRMCKYVFTEEEKRDIAETLAIKTQEYSEKEEEKKSVMSSYTDQMKKLDIEKAQNARMYKDGYEMRNIECEVERNTLEGFVRYIRTDTGEEVAKRKMSMSERQLTIDQFTEKNTKPGKKSGSKQTDEEVKADLDQRKTRRLMEREKSSID